MISYWLERSDFEFPFIWSLQIIFWKDGSEIYQKLLLKLFEFLLGLKSVSKLLFPNTEMDLRESRNWKQIRANFKTSNWQGDIFLKFEILNIVDLKYTLRALVSHRITKPGTTADMVAQVVLAIGFHGLSSRQVTGIISLHSYGAQVRQCNIL